MASTWPSAPPASATLAAAITAKPRLMPSVPESSTCTGTLVWRAASLAISHVWDIRLDTCSETTADAPLTAASW